MLQQLLDRGLIVVSLDPFQHGERGIESEDELIARVFRSGNFRRSMWPIIGQTVLDAQHIVDWIFKELTLDNATPVVAGGMSMGGDIAVALAGIDKRISRVAAIVSTPDWTRPGMRSFFEPCDLIDQGDADRYSNWFYTQLDPITHLSRYERDCAITFECAANDTHVPPDGALRFRDALEASSADIYPKVQVNLHENYEHKDGSEQVFYQNCLDWLTDS